jgi:hypothetical protein
MADREPTRIADAFADALMPSVPLTVGRATIAWNTLSGAIYDLFSLLSEMDDATAKAVFFAVASDRSQRDMVSNLVNTKLKPEHPHLAKKVRSVIGEADDLAGKRNDILHVVFRETQSPYSVSQLHPRGHLKDKSGLELINAIGTFAISALDLTLKATKLRGQIAALPHYRRLALAAALLRYTPQRTPQELASQGEFGRLNVPATTPASPPENQKKK